jgi:hypothetical protein
MLYRWRRIDEADRGRVWRLYGWFCALMVCGSCVGVVTWTARAVYLRNVYSSPEGQPDVILQTSLKAVGYSWQSVYTVTYALEFMCLSAANGMVLDRMASFAAPPGSSMRKWSNPLFYNR